MQSEMWLNWALHITQLYNRCRNVHSARDQQQSQLVHQQQDGQPEAQVDGDGEPKLSGKCKEEMHANVCSNMYPALLMSLKNIDFGFVLQVRFVRIQISPGLHYAPLQYVAQTRMEQNALDLVFGLFNMGEQDAWREHQQQQHNAESTSSSLEILRTLNISFAAGDYHPAPAAYCDSAQDFGADVTKDHQSLRSKHTESFLQKERIFLAQLISKATEICPTIFGEHGHRNYLYLSPCLASPILHRWPQVGRGGH